MSDLADRCREILEWNATGLLHGGSGGKLRAYADSLGDIPENYRLALAQKKTEDDAMRFVVENSKQEPAMPKDKLSDHERGKVEHARRFAAQNLSGPPACFAETYRDLVAIIDRLAPPK